MSNKYWTDKTDNGDDVLANDFNNAFDKISKDVAKIFEDSFKVDSEL